MTWYKRRHFSPWTPERVKRLEELWPTHSAGYIALILGPPITRGAVNHKAESMLLEIPPHPRKKIPRTRYKLEPEDYMLLQACAATMSLRATARFMGMPQWVVTREAAKLNLRPLKANLRGEPKSADWMRIAAEEAQSAGLKPSVIVGHNKTRPVVQARWRALKRLMDENPHCSLAGVGRVVGCDHSSLIHMLRRTNSPASMPVDSSESRTS